MSTSAHLKRLPSGRLFNTTTGQPVGPGIPTDGDYKAMREWELTHDTLIPESLEDRQYNHWLWSLRVGDFAIWCFTGGRDENGQEILVPELLRVARPFDGVYVYLRHPADQHLMNVSPWDFKGRCRRPAVSAYKVVGEEGEQTIDVVTPSPSSLPDFKNT